MKGKSDMRKKYRQLEAAIEPLKLFEGIFSEHDEKQAKSALTDFFERLRGISPDKTLDLGSRHNYYSFYINLLPVMEALKDNHYAKACHEIITLNYYEPILQMRIYKGLMFLQSEFLR